MRHILTLTAIALLAIGSAVPPAPAATKVNLLYIPGGDFVPSFVAKDQGIFERHGLDVDMSIAQNGSVISAALAADQAQIGVPTPPVLLQANEQGLDLVIVAGATVLPFPKNAAGVIAREGSNLKGPQDLVGHKVGVPGIGAALHVLFRYYLLENKVDFHKVDFAETLLPRMRDLLAAKTVDAVVAVNPFIGQITGSGAGYLAVALAGQIPSGKPVIMYVTTREWAEQHKAELAAFRAGIFDGAKFVVAEPDRTKEDANRYAKLPPQVLKAAELSDQVPNINTDDLAWWFGVMKQQGMLTHDLDMKKLLYP